MWRTVFPAASRLGFRAALPNLDFQTKHDGTVAVVAPTGELDLPGAAVLEAELERVEAEPRLGTVVLDLRGLGFMDSSGLRLVVMADMRLREAGRRLVLVRGAETVQRVFEITRIAERLEFVDDPGEAR
jgi:anti-sigma B factor antagonist